MEIPEADPIDRDGQQRIEHPNCLWSAELDFSPVTDHGVNRQQQMGQRQSVDKREEQHDEIECLHGIFPDVSAF
ncbi:MAG: hypothetical protein WB810_04090 [Candidatus Cybelea sp.]